MSNAHRARTSAFSQTTLLSASLATASSLVALQLLSRIVTFILNQALVRLAPPEVFGTASVQFDLLLATILFLSREGVRNALLRANEGHASSSPSKPHPPSDPSNPPPPPYAISQAQAQATRTANLSLLPVYFGLPLSVLTSLLYLLTSTRAARSQPGFALSVALYAVGAFLVLLAEPLHIRAVNELRMGARVRAEGTGVVVQSVATFLLMLRSSLESSTGAEKGAGALLAFAWGKVVYGLVLCAVYVWEFRTDSPFYSLWPRKTIERVHGHMKTRYFDPHLLRLSLAMSAQGLVKHFLTEGDSLILARVSSLEDQGGYAVANNYGSLIARIIFLPLEETSRLFFSKTLSSPDSSPTPSHTSPAPPVEALQSASDVLSTLLLFDTHLLLFFLTLGPPLLPTLLGFVLPRRYLATSAPKVLVAYCTYLPIMAYNGILEAFFASTAEQPDLTRQARAMLLFSAVFLAAAWGLMSELGLAEVGLVYANTINLSLRAGYCWAYVLRYFRDRGQAGLVGWRKASPPWPVWTTFAGVGAVLRGSEARFVDGTLRGCLLHLAVGGLGGVVCLAVCTGTQWAAVGSIVSLVRRKR